MKALIALTPQKPSPLEQAMIALVRGTARSEQNRGSEARKIFPDNKAVDAILARGLDRNMAIERADQTIGTTGTSGWASQVVPNAMGEFLGSLAPLSAAAALMSRGLKIGVPPGHAGVTIPGRTGNPPATVNFVKEGDPIPVRKFTLNSDAALTPKKFGMIVTFSRELTKRANGEEVMRTLLREDAAVSLDAAYFSATAISDTAHPGLLNGLTAIAGYAGGDRQAAQTDLTALANAVSAAGSGQVLFVVSPQRYGRLPLLWPDLDVGSFVPSLAVADDTIVATDPLSIVHGFGEDYELDASTDAVLHMEDTSPLEIVSGTGPTTADPVRSLWQTATIALRLIGEVAFAKRRSGAVAYVTGATW